MSKNETSLVPVICLFIVVIAVACLFALYGQHDSVVGFYAQLPDGRSGYDMAVSYLQENAGSVDLGMAEGYERALRGTK